MQSWQIFTALANLWYRVLLPSLVNFFPSGITAPSGPWLPHYRVFTIASLVNRELRLLSIFKRIALQKHKYRPH
jgi:hypothetical protein